ncbi:Ig-like domain-containing protein [Prolixibacteraceae bacterium]|nr:Ig-like domain-containing protein [Prolixibacteraceae bacterium]
MNIRALCSYALLAFFAFGCSKDSDKDVFSVKTKEIEFFSGDKAMIIAESPTSIYYKSRNVEVALANNTGEITGQKVGKTEIVVTDGTNSTAVSVEVKAKYPLWEAPVGLVAGSSVSDLISLRGKPHSLKVNPDNPDYTYVCYLSNDLKIEKVNYVYQKDKFYGADLRYVQEMCPNLKDAFKERYFVRETEKYDLLLFNHFKSENWTICYRFNDKYHSVFYIPKP